MPSPTPLGATADRPAPAVYQLDDLLVDTGRATVTRDGRELPLPRLSFDLLVALIEAAPRILSLEDLMNRVWPGLVVSPETVSQRVKLLREALGDDARQPRYVAGVRGRGYRLVAQAARVGPADGERPAGTIAFAEARETGPPPMLPVWRRIPVAAVVAAVVAVVVAAVVLVSWWQRGPDGPPSAGGVAQPGDALADRSIAVLPFESVGGEPDSRDLALGVPETVLHQLARLPGLTVIARSSSFAVRGQSLDAREIGRRLGARYLLEGSVQASGQRLRVTASLVDTTSGAGVWSVQFERPVTDVFAIQDEIAHQVARALVETLEQGADAAAIPPGGGTADYDAYLAFLRGRALLGSLRIADLPGAIAAFEAAIRRDPGFAAPRVQLARARVAVAEQLPPEERRRRFQGELDAALRLVEEALKLDPQNAEAYVERGYLKLYFDLAGADADLRRGLELAPSSARAYEGLATVLFQSAARRGEALQMIRRARRIDPLEPRLQVIEATYLLYGPADVDAAARLLEAVRERAPLYVPALLRLGELRWCCQGRLAEAVLVTEQAVALDPGNGSAWRQLAAAYLALDEVSVVRALRPRVPQETQAFELGIEVHERNWHTAARIAESMLDSGQWRPQDERPLALAIRRQAHATRQYARGIEALENMTLVEWDHETPLLGDDLGLGIAVAGLGELLAAGGHPARARKLLEALLADIDRQRDHLGRGAMWMGQARAMALTGLGRQEEALAVLERQLESGALMNEWREALIEEPVFDQLRPTRRFRDLEAEVARRVQREEQELERMREQGLVPRRSP